MDRQFGDHFFPGQHVRLDQRLGEQRQRDFQSDDAERREDELKLFFLATVRGVIGGEALDCAIDPTRL